jgi:hypothetical protein
MLIGTYCVSDVIEELKTEVDIAIEIPDYTYLSWLNSLHQLLYTEIIKEQKKVVLTSSLQSPVDISKIDINDEMEEPPRFEDIYAVYTDDGTQLKKSTLTSGVIFPNTFYKDDNKLGYNAKPTPESLTIIYIVRPKMLNTADDLRQQCVCLPDEFIDLAKAKLRGEAYKLANEDKLAAKWLNDYNTLLETFKAWIAEKSPNFGL